MIKAIETKYKGYRFRSRLEARWAVFFDSMCIKYKYEPEGYDLESFGYYLPDFYLPEFNCFVEVKGDKTNFNNDLDKLESLCDMNDSIGVMLGGDPLELFDDLDTFQLICTESTDSTSGPIVDRFLFCHLDGVPMIIPKDVTDGSRGRNYFTSSYSSAARVIDAPDDRVYPRGISFYLAKLAAIKARSARFEHGEKG